MPLNAIIIIIIIIIIIKGGEVGEKALEGETEGRGKERIER